MTTGKDELPDERTEPRYEGRLEAHLLVDGARWRCWIRDLSPGGAGLEPALPGVLGRTVELHSTGFDFAGGLPGRVINVAHRRTSMAFDRDPGLRERLTAFLLANVAPS